METAERRTKITLINGREFELREMTTADLEDLATSGRNPDDLKSADLCFVTWLLARRTGKTQEEAIKGEWAIPWVEFREVFLWRDLMANLVTIKLYLEVPLLSGGEETEASSPSPPLLPST